MGAPLTGTEREEHRHRREWSEVRRRAGKLKWNRRTRHQGLWTAKLKSQEAIVLDQFPHEAPKDQTRPKQSLTPNDADRSQNRAVFLEKRRFQPPESV